MIALSKYATVPQSASDWKIFYDSLETDANIPDASFATIDNNNAVFYSPFLDLSIIKKQLGGSPFKPVAITVYADIVSIPDGFTWTIANGTLTIYSRKLYCGATARINIDFTSNLNSSLIVFTNEIVTSLRVTTLNSQSGDLTRITLNTIINAGFKISSNGGKGQKTDLSLSSGIPKILNDAVKLYFNNLFLYGSVLFSLNKSVSLNINRWINKWTAGMAGLNGLYFQSSSLSALLTSQVNAGQNGSRFVPFLSKEIYEGLASAFVAEANDYEQNYLTLSTQNVLTDQNIQLAKALCDTKQYESDFFAAGIEQARKNLYKALQAQQAAQFNFNREQRNTDLVRIDFELQGIPAFEREAAFMAALDIIKAVIEIAGAIALMCAGQEEAAPGAVEGAAGAASEVEILAEVDEFDEIEIMWQKNPIFEGAPKLVDKAEEAIKKHPDIADSLKKAFTNLKDAIEALNKILGATSAIFSTAFSIKDNESTTAPGSMIMQPAGFDINDDSLPLKDCWDVYLIEMDKAIQPAIDKEIGFSADYLAQIHKLAIYGKSLSDTGEAVIQAGNEISKLLLQQGLAKQQTARLKQLADTLVVGKAPITEMMQVFYNRLLVTKGYLFTATQYYKSAFFYWALRESSLTPSILETVGTIASGINNITQIKIDDSNVLAQFNPPPTKLSEITCEIDDPIIIDQLKKTNAAGWTIDLENQSFSGLNRVRLDEIQVWLEGAKIQKKTDAVTIRIFSSGNYHDRLNGQSFHFSSEFFQRDFKYQLNLPGTADFTFDNQETGRINLATIIDEPERYAYTRPTPFTDWTIKLSQSDNPTLDLQGVTKIIMVFKGTAIGN